MRRFPVFYFGLDTKVVRYWIHKMRVLVPDVEYDRAFFSSEGYALNDLRQHLTPENLKQQRFLKVNKKFGSKKTINDILTEDL